ncbi:hypothetical protein X963_4502 [Burkholderia pseudomallei MSHR7498]|nr:hypothetical protein X963_4502 [Burkholderia pseudomallei MSHR7498]
MKIVTGWVDGAGRPVAASAPVRRTRIKKARHHEGIAPIRRQAPANQP